MLGSGGPLIEVEPGLFFTEAGLTFDVRGSTPLFSEIPMVKATPQTLPFRMAIYGLCGFLFLSTLFLWPIRKLVHRVRRNKSELKKAGSPDPHTSWLGWIGVLAAIASLFSLFCLTMIVLVPNLVYFPWPRPFADLTWWQYSLLCLPIASLATGVVIGLLGAFASRAGALRWYYLAVALALVAFNGIILL
jgi:hypothetical protein